MFFVALWLVALWLLVLRAYPFAKAAPSHLCALTAPYFFSVEKKSKQKILAPPGALRFAPGPLSPVSLRGIAAYELQATLRLATSAIAEGASHSPLHDTSTRPFWLTGQVDQDQKQKQKSKNKRAKTKEQKQKSKNKRAVPTDSLWFKSKSAANCALDLDPPAPLTRRAERRCRGGVSAKRLRPWPKLRSVELLATRSSQCPVATP